MNEPQEQSNEDQVEMKMMNALKGLFERYEIRESWVLQFINQNLYLSNEQIIDFVHSCQQISLKEGDCLSSRLSKQDYVYCLLLGRAKLMKQSDSDSNWELKKHKLVSLHNYKVSVIDDPFCIVADSSCRVLQFPLPLTKDEQMILNSKRTFLCKFFDVDFNRINFEVLDLFKPVRYIVGQKLSVFRDKIIIVKEGMCNYSTNADELTGNKIKLIDRNGPFVINYEGFIEYNNDPFQITVKEAQIACLEASIEELVLKSFYYSGLVKKIKQKFEKEHKWLISHIKRKDTQSIDSPQKTIKKIKMQSRESITGSNQYSEGKKLFDNDEQQLNLMTKSVFISKLINKQKRVSMQLDMDQRSKTPRQASTDVLSTPSRQIRTSRKSIPSATLPKQNPEQPPILPTSRQMFSKMINLKMLNEYQTTIIHKKKILNQKLKPYQQKQLFLYFENPNIETQSFKRRMIQSGMRQIEGQKLKHTDSSKKFDDLKNKYIKKIEKSNKIGMQGMIIHSNSLQDLQRGSLESNKNIFSTRRLSNADYYNYLIHGDTQNPKQEALERVHQRIKILRASSTAAYSHKEHLKSKTKLLRYSSTKVRSLKKPL